MEDHDMSNKAYNEDAPLYKSSGCGCLGFLIVYIVYILWIVIEEVWEWFF